MLYEFSLAKYKLKPSADLIVFRRLIVNQMGHVVVDDDAIFILFADMGATVGICGGQMRLIVLRRK